LQTFCELIYFLDFAIQYFSNATLSHGFRVDKILKVIKPKSNSNFGAETTVL